MADSELDQAIDMIRRGDKYSGNALLHKFISKHPGDDAPYLLLSEFENTDRGKVVYLERALMINPSNIKTMEEIIFLIYKKGYKYIKYFEITGSISCEINLGQFLLRYEAAILNQSDIFLEVVFNLSGSGPLAGGGIGGFAVAEETHFIYENGTLKISEGGYST